MQKEKKNTRNIRKITYLFIGIVVSALAFINMPSTVFNGIQAKGDAPVVGASIKAICYDTTKGKYSNNESCADIKYHLEVSNSYQLEVIFNEAVILDNWKIIDEYSKDAKVKESGWEWQDGIRVEAFDNNGNYVEIKTKIGDNVAGVVKDNDGFIHIDKDKYNAINNNFAKANSTNGSIVLTSNFKPIKKLVITHFAGTDVSSQILSTLEMAKVAVPKPLLSKGKVFDKRDILSPKENSVSHKTKSNEIDDNAVNIISKKQLLSSI